MKRYLCIISLFLFSCEEEITLELNQESEKIVVEGVIEQGFPPYVILSKNQGFFDPIDITTYANLFINDAEIKVWKNNIDGTSDTVNLEMIMIENIPIFTDLSYFSNPVSYEFSQPENTYFLEIKRNGEILNAETYIPLSTPLFTQLSTSLMVLIPPPI